MESREIVQRAIDFNTPPRLPFFLGDFWGEKIIKKRKDILNDVCDCWEMDRQKAGWFFDTPKPDDWGCGWTQSHVENMGQVVFHPLKDWAKLKTYTPPNPRDPFYFARIEEQISQAEDKFVVITCHFNLIERLHMLHGFQETLMDLYAEPEKIQKLLRMILDFKITQLDELKKRFPDRIHGVFLTDDWGTQQNTFISPKLFKEVFFKPYQELANTIHRNNWSFILHSCGRINAFIPYFIEAGIDVLNMQQPRTYGIGEIGEKYRGKICFLTTVDIQTTLPSGQAKEVEEEAELLVREWSVPEGGFIVFNYGDPSAIGATHEITETMFNKFFDLAHVWSDQ